MPIHRWGIITIAALVTILFPVAGFSQQDTAQNRTECIMECKQWFGALWNEGARGGSQGAYYRCLDDCDKKFWAEFDKDMSQNEFKN
jgi:hypothetical protein